MINRCIVLLSVSAVLGLAVGCIASPLPTPLPLPPTITVTAVTPALTSTPPPPTPAPTLTLSPQPSATPTKTSVATVAPASVPKRIQFPAGSTTTNVQGSLPTYGIDNYVLRVVGGQRMKVDVTSTQGKMLLSVSGADGQVFKSSGVGSANFDGTLPSTQDYYLSIMTDIGTPATYVLAVTIPPLTSAPEPRPARIAFPQGGTSASLQGTIAPFGLDRYVIRAAGGQTMSVNVTSPQSKVLLVIFGADGNVLISDHAGAVSWSGKLPTTQDYIIDVKSYGETSQTYTLQVVIPPLSP